MGVDIHIGPYLRVTGNYPTNKEKNSEWGCPTCQKGRVGAFCNKCGTKNQNLDKVVENEMNFYSFMEEYVPDAEEVLWAPESMVGMLLPNYLEGGGTSSYSMKTQQVHNKFDITPDVIDELLVEFGRRTARFVLALETHGIEYEIGFGAVTYYS